MASYQSPVLTERVPYDWEELKRAAQGRKDVRTAEQSDAGLVRLAPLTQKVTATNDQPVHELSDGVEASKSESASPSVELLEQELIARVVPKVIERLNSQIEIIVDVTLKTAGTRIRSDLQKAVENTVRLTVKEELKNMQK